MKYQLAVNLDGGFTIIEESTRLQFRHFDDRREADKYLRWLNRTGGPFAGVTPQFFVTSTVKP